MHQKLRAQYNRIDQQEQFSLLRKLKFFHEFSHSEIWEVLRASSWQDYADGEEIVKEGEMDDRFYIIVQGRVGVARLGKALGYLDSGDCFGETSYVRGAKRTATIIASGNGHGHEGELYAARAGVGRMPAALQPGVPAQHDRPAAERGARSLAQSCRVFVVLDHRVRRMIVDRFEILRLDRIGAHPLVALRPTATSRTVSSTNFGLSYARSVTNFSSGRFRMPYTSHEAFDSATSISSSSHMCSLSFAVSVTCERWLCAP